jgi:hypothetical protein
MSLDQRSVKDQVKSGLLLAGRVVAAILIFALAALGFGWMHSYEHPFHFPGPLRAWLALVTAATIIFWTAERWLVIPGLVIVRGFFGGVFYVLFPVTSGINTRGLSRIGAAALVVYSVVLVPLVWRFVPPTKYRATIFDRIAITCYTLAIAAMVLFSKDAVLEAPLFGTIPLLLAWLIYLWNRSKRTQQRRFPQTDHGG